MPLPDSILITLSCQILKSGNCECRLPEVYEGARLLMSSEEMKRPGMMDGGGCSYNASLGSLLFSIASDLRVYS